MSAVIHAEALTQAIGQALSSACVAVFLDAAGVEIDRVRARVNGTSLEFLESRILAAQPRYLSLQTEAGAELIRYTYPAPVPAPDIELISLTITDETPQTPQR
jgi:hypothetical protein